MARKSGPKPRETVVTYLEMKAPPLRYPPMPVNLHLALLKTEKMPLHFYRYLIDRVGRQWEWVNALRMDDADLSAAIHAAGRDIHVLYLDGSPAGFFDLSVRNDGICELMFFGLMEHATGMGLGRWFLGSAIRTAWSHKPEKLAVQTCTLDHPAALALYQKLGFEAVGQSKERVVPLTPAERRKAVMQ